MEKQSLNSDREKEDEENAADIEPLLKYKRIKSSAISKLIRPAEEFSYRSGGENISSTIQDSVASLAIHRRYIVIGLQSGLVLQCDHEGNPIRQYSAAHQDRVTSLSIDETGQWFASASVDGRINLYVDQSMSATAETASPQPVVFHAGCPVNALQLESSFSKSKCFVYGGADGRLMLKTMGWWSSSDCTIHRGQGPITTIAWKGRFIAWANDAGVKVYDHVEQQRIAFIRNSSSGNDATQTTEGLDPCRCHLVFSDEKTLLIAWDNSIKIIAICQRSASEMASNSTLCSHSAELVYSIGYPETETICGIAPLGEDHISVLVYISPEVAEQHDNDTLLEEFPWSGAPKSNDIGKERPIEKIISYQPELRIFSRSNGEEISIEALPIYLLEENDDLDYSLISKHNEVTDSHGQPVLFVISRFDIIKARSRTLEDHIEWEISLGNYKKALELAESVANAAIEKSTRGRSVHNPKNSKFLLGKYSIVALQDKLLNHLLLASEFDEAASLCPRLLGDNSDRWLQWAAKFESYRALSSLAKVLPVGNLKLPSVLFESILAELLSKNEFSTFLEVIQHWQFLLYKRSKAERLSKGIDNAFVSHGNCDVGLSVTIEEETKLGSVKLQSLYDVKRVMESVQTVIDEKFGRVPRAIHDALAELCCADGQYGMAVQKYLEPADMCSNVDPSKDSEAWKTRIDRIFSLIEANNLMGLLSADKVSDLAKLDMHRTTKLLVSTVVDELSFSGFVSIGDLSDSHLQYQGNLSNKSAGFEATANHIFNIVKQLGGHRDGSLSKNVDLEPLYHFLHNLFIRRSEEYNSETLAPLHDIQVRLYVMFCPEKLQDFLESMSYYSLDKAMKECENASPVPLYKELVYILGRLGGNENTQRALKIILHDLQSVDFAIDFVENEGDETLWLDLLRQCMRRNDLLGDLLVSAGMHDVEPVKIISLLPPDLRLEGLPMKLEKLFGDLRLKKRMLKECNNALKLDVVELHKVLYRKRRRAFFVPSVRAARCGICRLVVHSSRSRVQSEAVPALPSVKVVVFGNMNIYHYACIYNEAQRRLDPVSSRDSMVTDSTQLRNCAKFGKNMNLSADS